MPVRPRLSAASGLSALLLCLMLAGCGFQLRGAQSMPFPSLYVAMSENSEISTNLKRQIRANAATELVGNREGAAAILSQQGETRMRQALSYNAAGRVREIQLQYRTTFLLQDPQGKSLSTPMEIYLTRDVTYDDSQVLSKTQEEELLWQDMQRDLVQQLLRRMSKAKPPAAADED